MPDQLHYRFATDDELPQAARLAAHSFPGIGRTLESWEEQLRDPPTAASQPTLFAGFAADRMVAALQLHPFRQWIGGEALPMAGVGTVAIAPTHRRLGLAAELMAAALRAARTRGDVVSALYPFRAAFYARLGYGLAGEVLQYRVPTTQLPDSAERHRVDLLDDDAGRAAALALYQAWAASQTGQLVRTERIWALRTDGRVLVGYRDGGGELRGYAIVAYRVDLPPAERFLDVEELVWSTPAARAALYGWMASLSDQWTHVMLRALPQERVIDLIGDVKLPHGTLPSWGLWAAAGAVLHGPMSRIVDLPGALAHRRVAEETSLSFQLRIVDEQLPENAGDWQVEAAAGALNVRRGTGARASVALATDIATFSRVCIGALDLKDAFAAGRLECDRPERLAGIDAVLALPQPWMFDRF